MDRPESRPALRLPAIQRPRCPGDAGRSGHVAGRLEASVTYKGPQQKQTRARVEARDQSARRHGELDDEATARVLRENEETIDELRSMLEHAEAKRDEHRDEAGRLREALAELREMTRPMPPFNPVRVKVREALSLGEQLEGPGSSGVPGAEAPTTSPKDEHGRS